MAFKDVRLDVAMADDGVQGFPDFEPVRISQSEAGLESRASTKDKALGVWTISYNAQRPALWKKLRAHHYVVGGRLHSFPFRDWLDYQCTASESHLESIDSAHWQMCKRWTLGGLTYDEEIILPITATVSITGSGSYSVSRTTGIITKLSGADPSAFSCDFDKLVRYDGKIVQQLVTHKRDGERIVESAGITIREIPLAAA